jgi:chitin disaccharide deacetylase
LSTNGIMLIVNADDFGLRDSCTRAIGEAFSKGLISSTTMCANGSHFQDACEIAMTMHLEDRIGIHLNLTEGRPLTAGIRESRKFCDEQGQFHGRLDRLAPLSRQERVLVSQELSAQVERMRRAGLPITHADSHHHVHTGLFLGPVVVEVLKQSRITKVRLHRNIGGISLPKRLVKWGFNLYLRLHGFAVVQRFGSFADYSSLRDPDRTSLEIMVHPDYDQDGNLIDDVAYDPSQISRTLQQEFDKLGTRQLRSYAEL